MSAPFVKLEFVSVLLLLLSSVPSLGVVGVGGSVVLVLSPQEAKGENPKIEKATNNLVIVFMLSYLF
jgi:hypothetical protein